MQVSPYTRLTNRSAPAQPGAERPLPPLSTARELPHGARSILCAATELFARDGYGAVSVGAIAERAGVSKSNVFHHFANKEELFLAVMRDISLSYAEFAETLLDEPGASADKLRRLIAFEIVEMFEDRQKMRLLLREIIDGADDNAHALAQQIFHRGFRATIALFEQGQARGELRADFDPAAATMMVGGASHLFLQSYETLRQLPETCRINTAQTYADQIFDILLGGILAPPAAKTVAPKHAVRKHAVHKHKVAP